MKGKKLSKVIALILALQVILTACGGGNGGGGSTGAGEGQTTLVFWHAMGGNAGEALQKLVDEYNASQDEVFVDAQYQGSYDETLTKLRSSASGAGLGADLVQVFELGTTFMIDSGLTVPMQEYVDSDSYDLSKLEPNLLAYYTIDNTLHSMPFNSSTPIMYYNVDYFEEAGITEIPTNLEEIYAINDQLVENTDASMALSLTIYGWYMEQWFSKQEADIFNNGNGREDRATEVVFDQNGAMEKILNTWKKGVDSGAAPNVGRNGGQPEFVSGQSAITIGSTANLRQILTEVDNRFEVGTAYYPGLDSQDKGGVSIGGASLWMIDSGDDAKKDATWDFIKYLITPEVQAQWNADTGYFPVNVGAHEEPVFQENIKEFPQFQTAIDQLHDSTPADQGSLSGVNQEARQIYENELERHLNEELEAKEAVDSMANQVNSALENYNAANQ